MTTGGVSAPEPQVRTLDDYMFERGLTNRELGAAIGVSAGAVQAWRRGMSKPYPRSFEQLLQVLEIAPEEIDLHPRTVSAEEREQRRQQQRRLWDERRQQLLRERALLLPNEKRPAVLNERRGELKEPERASA